MKLAGLLLEFQRELTYLKALSMGLPVSQYWDAHVA
jgi:hypothetical protein